MTCECGKPALFQVGKRGFCKEHRDEAITAAQRNGNASLSTGKSFRGEGTGFVIGNRIHSSDYTYWKGRGKA